MMLYKSKNNRVLYTHHRALSNMDEVTSISRYSMQRHFHYISPTTRISSSTIRIAAIPTIALPSKMKRVVCREASAKNPTKKASAQHSS